MGREALSTPRSSVHTVSTLHNAHPEHLRGTSMRIIIIIIIIMMNNTWIVFTMLITLSNAPKCFMSTKPFLWWTCMTGPKIPITQNHTMSFQPVLLPKTSPIPMWHLRRYTNLALFSFQSNQIPETCPRLIR